MRLVFLGLLWVSLLPWLAYAPALSGAVRLAVVSFAPIEVSQFRLRFAPTQRFIDEIESALEVGRYGQAQRLAALAQAHDHDLPTELVNRIEPSSLTRLSTGASDLARGAFLGEAQSGAQIAGLITADLLVVGDVRDLAVQTLAWSRGEEVDRFILGLSLVGLATSAGALAAGASAGVDAGIALTKAARRAGRMSVRLADDVSLMLRRVIDQDALASLARRQSDELAEGSASLAQRLSRVVRMDEAGGLLRYADGVGTIARTGGPQAALASLELADDARDLERLASVARHLGDGSAAAFKIAGKSLLRLADLVWTALAAILPVLLCALYALLRLALWLARRAIQP